VWWCKSSGRALSPERLLVSLTNNPFDKKPAERQQIADDIANIEPLLR
jgi:hypothetical protein